LNQQVSGFTQVASLLFLINKMLVKMNEQATVDYNRIAEAIEYIRQNFKEQPNLSDVAEKIHLSPFHSQRLFTEWAGVSPKKFLQYISVQHAKKVLSNKEATLFDAVYETGLSGSGRLHDLFIKIEGMTPGEFKNGGANLTINYSFADSPFGDIILASTSKGICHMAFMHDRNEALANLKYDFPNARFTQVVDRVQQNVFQIFKRDWRDLDEIRLHVKGSEFQIKVWETLLKIPMGGLSTYGTIAKTINNPNASRAVGTAIGDNPIAYLIPCHRVIRSTGIIGEYRWGTTRKTAMIGWEAAKQNI
jgi:AraC family transcriptional regulator of adaptative response/methylated-DNA-[protein]-cysteine methyltransferase